MGIQTLKHLAFKIWTAAALAIPLSLGLLSMMSSSGSLAMPLVLSATFFILFFVVSGWLACQVALRLLPAIIHEAGVWERSGDFEKAEQAYRKALSLYDSFMVSPRIRRRGIPPLVSRVARMYAAQTEQQATAERFMEAYLGAYPTDHEIAENWLQTREYHGGLAADQQDLAVRIGETHVDHSAIQLRLARLYLLAKRTDFPALQTYRRAMASPQANASRMAPDLARVFLQEGRADEWALPVYLQAAEEKAASEALRCGIAACLRWIRPSAHNADQLNRARQVLGRLDEETLVRMSSGFVPPTGSYTIDNGPQKDADAGQPLLGRMGQHLKTAGSEIKDVWQRLHLRVVGQIRRSAGLRRFLTWSIVAGLGAAAAAFLINTVGYLTPTPPPEPRVAQPPPVEAPAPPPPMPYTLQVAAYLKPEHAQHYLENLEKQGLDAYVVQAYGNEKTWYQVRIAHFPDKSAARAFGSSLKEKGIIEDFYVARDQSP